MGSAEGLVESDLPYGLVTLSACEYRVHFSSERLVPMPKQYPGEFRQRAVALVRSGKPVKHVAEDLGISAGGLLSSASFLCQHSATESASPTQLNRPALRNRYGQPDAKLWGMRCGVSGRSIQLHQLAPWVGYPAIMITPAPDCACWYLTDSPLV